MSIFVESYIKYLEACRSEYFGIPKHRAPKNYKPATKSHEEQKKCKSCAHFTKSEVYCYCSEGCRNVWPLKEACSSYKKRRRRSK